GFDAVDIDLITTQIHYGMMKGMYLSKMVYLVHDIPHTFRLSIVFFLQIDTYSFLDIYHVCLIGILPQVESQSLDRQTALVLYFLLANNFTSWNYPHFMRIFASNQSNPRI
ncbi:hypothetical protein ACJX0J_025400, partial [Zea mays]